MILTGLEQMNYFSLPRFTQRSVRNTYYFHLIYDQINSTAYVALTLDKELGIPTLCVISPNRVDV